MWWLRPLLAALAVTAALGVAGCGIQPLYGTTAGGSRLGAVMAGVDVPPIPGRVGQRVRNELIFENTGGGGAAPTTYQLDATFRLISHDGRVVLEGKATSRAAYERFETIFSNVRARVDAENRAARTVADTIRVRIAAYISQQA